MKSPPANIIIYKNKRHTPTAWLAFLDITLTNDTALRFVRNTESVAKREDDYSLAGCVGHWKMNDNAANTTVVDASGNGHTGVAPRNTSLMTVAGKLDRALGLNGSEKITVPYAAGWPFASDVFTIGLWVKWDAAPADCSLLGQSEGGGNNLKWMLVYDVDPGRLRFHFQNPAGTSKWVDWSWSPSADTWYFLVIVRNGSSWKYYCQATCGAGGTQTEATAVPDVNDSLDIGSDGEAWQYFPGAIDNLTFFDRALTQEEITYLYNGGNGTETNPQYYEAFNFDIEPSKVSNKGEMRTTRITVHDIQRVIAPYLQELDGAVGSEVKLTVINSALLHEDYVELEAYWDIVATHTEDYATIFTLGRPNILHQRYPLHRYFALHCRWHFESVECDYTRKTVAGVTLSGSDPVSVEVTAHGAATGDVWRLAGIAGITPSLAGNYTLTRTDADNFTLDDSDSSDYSGAYTSGGTAGYATCKRTLADCRDRESAVRFGGFPGMRSGGVRIA